jgi:hypothetical protein
MFPNGVLNPETEGIGASSYHWFTELEQRLSYEWGYNFVNVRKELINRYDFGGIKLLSAFTQPALNGNVQISVSDTEFLTTYNSNDVTHLGSTVMNKIAIGINNVYDIYEVISVDSAILMTVKLVSSTAMTTEFPLKTRIDTGSQVANLIDSGGNSDVKYLRIVQNADLYCFNRDILASTMRLDGIHIKDLTVWAKIIRDELTNRRMY